MSASSNISIRDDLNRRVPRVMAISDPLKDRFDGRGPTGEDRLSSMLRPTRTTCPWRARARCRSHGENSGSSVSDFAEDPPKGFRRLGTGPGGAPSVRIPRSPAMRW